MFGIFDIILHHGARLAAESRCISTTVCLSFSQEEVIGYPLRSIYAYIVLYRAACHYISRIDQVRGFQQYRPSSPRFPSFASGSCIEGQTTDLHIVAKPEKGLNIS